MKGGEFYLMTTETWARQIIFLDDPLSQVFLYMHFNTRQHFQSNKQVTEKVLIDFMYADYLIFDNWYTGYGYFGIKENRTKNALIVLSLSQTFKL